MANCSTIADLDERTLTINERLIILAYSVHNVVVGFNVDDVVVDSNDVEVVREVDESPPVWLPSDLSQAM